MLWNNVMTEFGIHYRLESCVTYHAVMGAFLNEVGFQIAFNPNSRKPIPNSSVEKKNFFIQNQGVFSCFSRNTD